MRNVLALYLDTSPAKEGEMNRLIEEMEEAIWEKIEYRPERLQRKIEQHNKEGTPLITLAVLENALGYTAESISSMRNGRRDVPGPCIRVLRLLHREVLEDPTLATVALSDYIDRKEKD